MTDEPLLRPWKTADAPTLLRHLRGSADLARQLPRLDDVAAARAWIESRTDGWYFAVVVNGVAMGNVSVGHVDRTHSLGWTSYWLAPQARGRGWAKRAAATVADHCLFGAADPVFRLELGHRVDNLASQKVALAAGFVLEGWERQKLSYDGTRFDTLAYSRLATDPRPDVAPLLLEA